MLTPFDGLILGGTTALVALAGWATCRDLRRRIGRQDRMIGELARAFDALVAIEAPRPGDDDQAEMRADLAEFEAATSAACDLGAADPIDDHDRDHHDRRPYGYPASMRPSDRAMRTSREED